MSHDNSNQNRDILGEVERCPGCGHQPHPANGCLNMASDNDCDCKVGSPEDEVLPDPAFNAIADDLEKAGFENVVADGPQVIFTFGNRQYEVRVSPMPGEATDIDYEIRPDWSHVWRAKDAERELSGFKFEGPGWYLTKDDVLLVIPTGARDNQVHHWAHAGHWDEEQLFQFYVYNGRSPIQAFNELANAPVKVDTRGQAPHDAVPADEPIPEPRAFDDTDLQREIKAAQSQLPTGDYSLYITNPGPMKIPLIKVLRNVLNLGLKNAKDLVEMPVPIKVVEGISENAARSIRRKLQEVNGVTARQVKGVPHTHLVRGKVEDIVE